MPEEFQLQSPASAAHPGAYGRETVQMLLLRSPLQTAVPCAATHATPHG